MNPLPWIADRLILAPSTDPIDSPELRRQVVKFAGGVFEMWGFEHGEVSAAGSRLQVLKFPGTGGRAERIGPHPCECWPDMAAEIWGVNPPGYGTQGGRARVANIPAVADAATRFCLERAPGSPLLVVGNSLGCLSALYAAARFPVAGLYLRNPPPIHQLIRKRLRYNWWNGGAAKWIAAQVPSELDALENARRCDCPALFVSSERDRVIPVLFQKQIIDAYRGVHRVFTNPGADHHHPIDDAQKPDYLASLHWLRSAMESAAEFRAGGGASAIPQPDERIGE